MCNYVMFIVQSLYAGENDWEELPPPPSQSIYCILRLRTIKHWRTLWGWSICFFDNSNCPHFSPASVVQYKSYTMSMPSHTEIVVKFTDEQYTTINQSTAGRFDPRVFVNCLQDHQRVNIHSFHGTNTMPCTHVNTTSMTPCRYN